MRSAINGGPGDYNTSLMRFVISGDLNDSNTIVLELVISGGIDNCNTTRLWGCINDCMLALHYDSSVGGWNTILAKEYIVMKVWMTVMLVREILVG